MTAQPTPSTATYCLLSLLALRPWTGYDLTNQARRSLHFIWPTSEAHLYREQKKLVTIGWATAETEMVGRRARKRYSITDEGRAALEHWTTTDPAPPLFAVEGIVRTFFGDHATVDSLAAAMQTTAAQAREMLDEFMGFIDEYLDTGGAFPERLHVVALAIEVYTDLLATLERFFPAAAEDIQQWDTTTRGGLEADTRARLERIRERHHHG
jgi:PadR family transcriptional regulator AphA